MRGFTLLLALVFLIVPAAAVLAEAPIYEPPVLEFEKECVIVGRLLGTDVMLYPVGRALPVEEQLPAMARIRGFEILNVTTGESQQLYLSQEGYFCANVGMGQYDLRGRDWEGRPYLVHRFDVPLHSAVNLGTFWVETNDPGLVALGPWYNYERMETWRMYREGAGRIAVRVRHDTSAGTYKECEDWFAECHEEAYEHFEKVMARR
ncbi:MAG: hypothetical protein JSV00_04360 [bacterium]|nr:MAG: hypothetical protein JSV00_04360 [bacterium]